NGLDGTLWIADMYRRVIEHPEWIPNDWQRRIDVRSGENLGRIYRAYRTDFTPFAKFDWTKADDNQLLAVIGSSSSAVSDVARQQLIWRHSSSPATISEKLRSMLLQSDQPVVRLRAIATLNAMRECTAADWAIACKDRDHRVLRWVIEAMAKQKLVRGELRDVAVSVSKTEAARQSAALGLQLIAALVLCERPAFEEAAALIAQHAGDPWIDQTITFLPTQGIDPTIKYLLANANGRTNGILDQLIPRGSQLLKQQLREQIVQGAAVRPGWHYALGRQFALDTDKSQQLDAASLDRLQVDAKAAIRNNQYELNARRSALDLVVSRASGNDSENVDLLITALSDCKDSNFSLALVKGIVSLGRPASTKVLDGWEKYSSTTQSGIIAESIAKEENAAALLERVANGTIGVDAFQFAQIEQLRVSKGAELQALVEKLFGPAPGTDRLAIVSDYTNKWPASSANPVRGELLYQQHCAQCHQDRTDANGVVPSVGPNLQALSAWKNEAWLSAILDPNRAVEAKYRRMSILTNDGSTIVGLKVRESEDRIEIINDQGALINLALASIEEMRESEKSLMPEGFEKVLTPEDLASVVTFIRKSR
ncbi:MAG TPA: c-type cytochrome, partial [Pirellula sp.]|nr:c-type cytochrome [Pirellula sp.]